MIDAINPAHYKGRKMECIDAIEGAVEDKHGIEAVCVANVIRYLWRYRDKHPDDPSTDPKKARWYLDRLIELLEDEEFQKVIDELDDPLPQARPAAHGTMD